MKCIALTFDDGPHPDTARLVRELTNDKIKATFFMTGANARAHPGLVRQVASTGSEIGNHSWNHPDLTRLSDAAVRRQLTQTTAAIERASGQRVTLVRPPFGARNARIDRLIKSLGLSGVQWDLDTLDWKHRTSAHVINCVLTYARRNDVVLMHDIHPTTVSAAPAVIQGLKQQGYTFVTVSELYPKQRPGGYYPGPGLSSVRACT